MKDFQHLTELPGTPQEQAWIKERLETLSVQEGIVLAAVTEEKPPVTAADAVNQFFDLSGHVVVRAASDYKQLGRFFAETIMLAPEHVREYMDYEKLGQMYEQKHPGRFSEGHYVFLPDREDPPCYNPETGTPPQDTDWSVKLKLSTPSVPEGVWLRFPDYENEFESQIDEVSFALDVLKVQTVQECTLLEARCSVPQAGNLMEQYTDIADLIYDGNELGFLLRQQSSDTPHFMEHLTAAMEYEHCDNLDSAMFLAKNIDCYEWIPTGEVQKIAEKSLRDVGISEEITQSGAIDLQAYGKDLLENCGFQLTSDGTAYIGRNSRDPVYEHDTSQAENAFHESFQHAELFGKPVLLTDNRIEHSTVPDGWYCYELRGSDYDPEEPVTLENNVGVNFCGSVLAPEEIPFPKKQDYVSVGGMLNYLGEEVTLREFGRIHLLEVPEPAYDTVPQISGMSL